MKLYFAGAEAYRPLFQQMKVQRGLTTYAAGERSVSKVLAQIPDVFIDSGAFTAFTRGSVIDLDTYIRFLIEHEAKTYASLDVIGDPAATMNNADRMIEAGLNPVVAFHYGSDYKHLEIMLDKYDRIALGGLVPIATRTSRLFRHLDLCFSIITKHRRWPIKVHGFGITQRRLMERYPFHSIDSTGWIGHKYGYIRLDHGRSAAIGTSQPREKIERLARSSHDVAASIATIANRDDLYLGAKRSIDNLRSLEKEMTKLWKARGLQWDDH